VRLARLFSSASFRLAGWYVVVFGVSVAVLLSVVYWNTRNSMEQQLTDSVEREMALLFDVSQARGLDSVVRGIQRRAADLKPPRRYYLLQSPSGERIAGNLPAMSPFEGWLTTLVPVPDAAEAVVDELDSRHSILLLGRRLPGGEFLVVGESRYRLIRAEEAILQAMGWGIAITVLLALFGGVLLRRGFLRRIEDINRTSREIMGGNLSNRVPTLGSGDEMDQLAVNLNAMLDRIQTLMESLKRVSDDIAHDLRTPLSRLRHRLETALERVRARADGGPVIEEALAEVDHILETFAALLRIAQIESGVRRAAFGEIALAAVARRVAETYGAVAEDRGQRVVARLDSPETIQGDQELLTQMIANLVENSIRHCPAGTEIGVALSAEGGEVVLSVSDTGPGIPVGEREKVLRRFYRLEASRTTPGSGLGLALVKAVAELHGAALELTDNVPQGLRVLVRFPKGERGVPRSAPVPAAPAGYAPQPQRSGG
jgi:signal transduction histidine kinase